MKAKFMVVSTFAALLGCSEPLPEPERFSDGSEGMLTPEQLSELQSRSADWTSSGDDANEAVFLAEIEVAKAYVASYTSDPSAVRFRNMSLAAGQVCGEANALNQFGAYTGFTPFVYDAGKGDALVLWAGQLPYACEWPAIEICFPNQAVLTNPATC